MHPIHDVLKKNKAGQKIGIPSYCTSNFLVIEALIARATKTTYPLLIEATANQVDQFGGYTGLKPAEFRDAVQAIADKHGLAHNRIILGGDHLGPLTWSNLPAKEAMLNAVELIRHYVSAGFTKIHLDTSMKLADDDPDRPLTDEIIARRGVNLYKVAINAYEELLHEQPMAERPVFVIGSEVPIPGGEQENEDQLQVTGPESLLETMRVYEKEFVDSGVNDGMDDVIAVVVQPGVEFGSDNIHVYNRENAARLSQAVRAIPGIVMEGHSTDYQPAGSLTEMVADGVGILKVGPGLTFALREVLFALSAIERVLVDADSQARFPETLDKVMLAKPNDWIKHYHGSAEHLKIERQFSLSDRSRYYLSDPSVEASINKLLANLEKVRIPLGLLHQYLPQEAEAIVASGRTIDVHDLIQQHVEAQAKVYEAACFN